MRDLFFRAWDDLSKKMLYWDELISSQNNLRLEFLRHGTNLHWMQFTGLLDHSGKEIYEGDLITLYPKALHGEWAVMIKEVIFHNGRFCFKDINGKYENIAPYQGWCVIGNIYENPELLKV